MKLDIKSYPLMLKCVCGVVLLPILAAPFVFYTTIFFFDNPASIGGAFLWFLAVNSYSLILLGICWASVLIYNKTENYDGEGNCYRKFWNYKQNGKLIYETDR